MISCLVSLSWEGRVLIYPEHHFSRIKMGFLRRKWMELVNGSLSYPSVQE